MFFRFTEKSVDFSEILNAVLLKVEWEMCFLWFSGQKILKICKIHGFWPKSTKSMDFCPKSMDFADFVVFADFQGKIDVSPLDPLFYLRTNYLQIFGRNPQILQFLQILTLNPQVFCQNPRILWILQSWGFHQVVFRFSNERLININDQTERFYIKCVANA